MDVEERQQLIASLDYCAKEELQFPINASTKYKFANTLYRAISPYLRLRGTGCASHATNDDDAYLKDILTILTKYDKTISSLHRSKNAWEKNESTDTVTDNKVTELQKIIITIKRKYEQAIECSQSRNPFIWNSFALFLKNNDEKDAAESIWINSILFCTPENFRNFLMFLVKKIDVISANIDNKVSSINASFDNKFYEVTVPKRTFDYENFQYFLVFLVLFHHQRDRRKESSNSISVAMLNTNIFILLNKESRDKYYKVTDLGEKPQTLDFIFPAVEQPVSRQVDAASSPSGGGSGAVSLLDNATPTKKAKVCETDECISKALNSTKQVWLDDILLPLMFSGLVKDEVESCKSLLNILANKCDEDDASAAYNYGRVLKFYSVVEKSVSRENKAIDMFEKCVCRDDYFTFAYVELGKIYLSRYEGAVKVNKKAQESLILLIKAKTWLDQAVQCDPENSEAHLYLGLDDPTFEEKIDEEIKFLREREKDFQLCKSPLEEIDEELRHEAAVTCMLGHSMSIVKYVKVKGKKFGLGCDFCFYSISATRVREEGYLRCSECKIDICHRCYTARNYDKCYTAMSGEQHLLCNTSVFDKDKLFAAPNTVKSGTIMSYYVVDERECKLVGNISLFDLKLNMHSLSEIFKSTKKRFRTYRCEEREETYDVAYCNGMPLNFTCKLMCRILAALKVCYKSIPQGENLGTLLLSTIFVEVPDFGTADLENVDFGDKKVAFFKEIPSERKELMVESILYSPPTMPLFVDGGIQKCVKNDAWSIGCVLCTLLTGEFPWFDSKHQLLSIVTLQLLFRDAQAFNFSLMHFIPKEMLKIIEKLLNVQQPQVPCAEVLENEKTFFYKLEDLEDLLNKCAVDNSETKASASVGGGCGKIAPDSLSEEISSFQDVFDNILPVTGIVNHFFTLKASSTSAADPADFEKKLIESFYYSIKYDRRKEPLSLANLWFTLGNKNNNNLKDKNSKIELNFRTYLSDEYNEPTTASYSAEGCFKEGLEDLRHLIRSDSFVNGELKCFYYNKEACEEGKSNLDTFFAFNERDIAVVEDYILKKKKKIVGFGFQNPRFGFQNPRNVPVLEFKVEASVKKEDPVADLTLKNKNLSRRQLWQLVNVLLDKMILLHGEKKYIRNFNSDSFFSTSFAVGNFGSIGVKDIEIPFQGLIRNSSGPSSDPSSNCSSYRESSFYFAKEDYAKSYDDKTDMYMFGTFILELLLGPNNEAKPWIIDLEVSKLEEGLFYIDIGEECYGSPFEDIIRKCTNPIPSERLNAKELKVMIESNYMKKDGKEEKSSTRRFLNFPSSKDNAERDQSKIALTIDDILVKNKVWKQLDVDKWVQARNAAIFQNSLIKRGIDAWLSADNIENVIKVLVLTEGMSDLYFYESVFDKLLKEWRILSNEDKYNDNDYTIGFKKDKEFELRLACGLDVLVGDPQEAVCNLTKINKNHEGTAPEKNALIKRIFSNIRIIIINDNDLKSSVGHLGCVTGNLSANKIIKEFADFDGRDKKFFKHILRYGRAIENYLWPFLGPLAVLVEQPDDAFNQTYLSLLEVSKKFFGSTTEAYGHLNSKESKEDKFVEDDFLDKVWASFMGSLSDNEVDEAFLRISPGDLQQSEDKKYDYLVKLANRSQDEAEKAVLLDQLKVIGALKDVFVDKSTSNFLEKKREEYLKKKDEKLKTLLQYCTNAFSAIAKWTKNWIDDRIRSLNNGNKVPDLISGDMVADFFKVIVVTENKGRRESHIDKKFLSSASDVDTYFFEVLSSKRDENLDSQELNKLPYLKNVFKKLDSREQPKELGENEEEVQEKLVKIKSHFQVLEQMNLVVQHYEKVGQKNGGTVTGDPRIEFLPDNPKGKKYCYKIGDFEIDESLYGKLKSYIPKRLQDFALSQKEKIIETLLTDLEKKITPIDFLNSQILSSMDSKRKYEVIEDVREILTSKAVDNYDIKSHVKVFGFILMQDLELSREDRDSSKLLLLTRLQESIWDTMLFDPYYDELKGKSPDLAPLLFPKRHAIRTIFKGENCDGLLIHVPRDENLKSIGKFTERACLNCGKPAKEHRGNFNSFTSKKGYMISKTTNEDAAPPKGNDINKDAVDEQLIIATAAGEAVKERLILEKTQEEDDDEQKSFLSTYSVFANFSWDSHSCLNLMHGEKCLGQETLIVKKYFSNVAQHKDHLNWMDSEDKRGLCGHACCSHFRQINHYHSGENLDASAIILRNGGLNSSSFSADGSKIALGNDDNSITIWDATGAVLQTPPQDSDKNLKPFVGHDGPVLSVCFSNDGARIVSGSKDMSVKIWDVKTGRIIRTFTGHKGPVVAVSFSKDGSKVVSREERKETEKVSTGETIKMWNVAQDSSLVASYTHALKGDEGPVVSVAFSANSAGEESILLGEKSCDVSIMHTLSGMDFMKISESAFKSLQHKELKFISEIASGFAENAKKEGGAAGGKPKIRK